MKIHVRDVVSFFGRDYLVEGVVGYHVNGKRFQLARAVDGDAVLWVDRKSTRLNSSHLPTSRMPSSA